MFFKTRWIMPIVVVLVIIVSMIFVFVQTSKDTTVSIFSDIQECNLLSNYETDQHLQDKYLGKLAFEKAYTAEIKYNSIEFQIFAYEFKNADLAKEYYANCWQIEVDTDCSYNFESGMYKTNGIVLNDKNIYRIKCSSSKIDDVKDYLSSIFSLVYTDGQGFISRPTGDG